MQKKPTKGSARFSVKIPVMVEFREWLLNVDKQINTESVWSSRRGFCVFTKIAARIALALLWNDILWDRMRQTQIQNDLTTLLMHFKCKNGIFWPYLESDWYEEEEGDRYERKF